jgi:tetratricopeptide (TPR) repeat protein
MEPPTEIWCTEQRNIARDNHERGNTMAAIQCLEALVTRIERSANPTGAELTLQLAGAGRELAELLLAAHSPDLARRRAQRIIELLEQTTDQAARRELAASFIALAKAHYDLVELEQAEDAARRGLELVRDFGDPRSIADALVTLAASLMRRQRYEEADELYVEALDTARATGDKTLEGVTLQRRGILQRRRNEHSHAIELFKQAIGCFQSVDDGYEQMRTSDMLGNAKVQFGELRAAESWYARSRELARQLGDRGHIAVVAHNMGILYQKRAEASDDPTTRDGLLQQGIDSVRESLAIKLDLNKQVSTEASYFQLGVMLWKQGKLEEAEDNMLQATAISEELGLPKVYQNYSILARIAKDQGDKAAAGEWNAKCVEKVLALKQRKKS